MTLCVRSLQVWYTVPDVPLIVVTNTTYKVWPFKAMVLTHGEGA